MDHAPIVVANPEYLKHLSPLAWLDVDKAEEIINSTEMKRVFHAVVRHLNLINLMFNFQINFLNAFILSRL